MPPEQRKTVRDYIPPADSTSLIDMLRTWTGVENMTGLPLHRFQRKSTAYWKDAFGMDDEE